ATDEGRSSPSPSEVRTFKALRDLSDALDRMNIENPRTDFWQRIARFEQRPDADRVAAEFTGLVNSAEAATLRIGKFTVRTNGGPPMVVNARTVCASRAYDLVVTYAHEPPNGSAEKPYLAIASLLYAAASGRR